MSTETIDRTTIRDRLKSTTPDEFQRAHTKAVLIEMAVILGLAEPAGTKPELYDLIVGAANLPDPSLRGKSSVEDPVAYVWYKADEMTAREGARRKDVVEACIAQGVAYHTARTQYQSWFTATDRGSKRLSELDPKDIPAALRPAAE